MTSHQKHTENEAKQNAPTRFKAILLSVCFLLVIAFPAFDFLVGISDPPAPTENRELMALPDFDINKLDPYPSAFDAWFSDNLPARTQLLSAYRLFKADALNTQAFPDKVLVGKDGWMYWVKNSMDDYRGTNRFTVEELAQFEAELLRRTQWCNQRGIKYYFVVVPNKHSIYGEHLPDNIFQIDPESRLDQLIQLGEKNTDLNLVDLRPALRAQKDKHRVFHKTDTHWNDLGGFFGYRAIIAALQRDFPNMQASHLSDFNTDTVVKQGMGLAKSMDVDKVSTEQVIHLKSKVVVVKRKADRPYPAPEGFTFPDDYAEVAVTDSAHLPKALIIRDSFTNYMLWFLPRNFSETVFIWDNWQYKLNEEIVEKEQPDVVITIVIERHLDCVLSGKNPSGE